MWGGKMQKPLEEIRSYLENHGVVPIASLDQINQGDSIVEIATGPDCDLLIALAQSCMRNGVVQEWDLKGPYMRVWLQDGAPRRKPGNFMSFSLTPEDIESKRFYRIEGKDSFLAAIADEIREELGLAPVASGCYPCARGTCEYKGCPQ